MIHEYGVAGIYFAAAPVTAGVALLVTLVIHRLLGAARLYHWIWHPALFDFALSIVIWAVIVLFLLSPGHGHD